MPWSPAMILAACAIVTAPSHWPDGDRRPTTEPPAPAADSCGAVDWRGPRVAEKRLHLVGAVALDWRRAPVGIGRSERAPHHRGRADCPPSGRDCCAWRSRNCCSAYCRGALPASPDQSGQAGAVDDIAVDHQQQMVGPTPAGRRRNLLGADAALRQQRADSVPTRVAASGSLARARRCRRWSFGRKPAWSRKVSSRVRLGRPTGRCAPGAKAVGELHAHVFDVSATLRSALGGNFRRRRRRGAAAERDARPGGRAISAFIAASLEIEADRADQPGRRRCGADGAAGAAAGCCWYSLAWRTSCPSVDGTNPSVGAIAARLVGRSDARDRA